MNRIGAASWSGGKDVCLAVWRAANSGIKVKTLIAMCEENGEYTRSHRVPVALMKAQADALGAGLLLPAAGWNNYEPVFTAALRQLGDQGHDTVVFGDIDLEAHRTWEEKVCAGVGIEPAWPLWGAPRAELVEQFLAAGFRAIVVCVNGKFLDPRFVGREFDRQFLADLPAGIDACGENGEFHTFVYDGPGFARPVRFAKDEVYAVNLPEGRGGGVYWYQRLLPLEV